MLKSTLILLLSSASTLAFHIDLPEGVAPTIKVPMNFRMENHVYYMNDEGNFFDSNHKFISLYDSEHNRVRMDLVDEKGFQVESTVTDFNNRVELKAQPKEGKCQKQETFGGFDMKYFMDTVFT